MTEIDVRVIQPRERHGLILSTFDKLAAGDSLELVNDHAPTPLYYQFRTSARASSPGESLEDGPEVWRVRITHI